MRYKLKGYGYHVVESKGWADEVNSLSVISDLKPFGTNLPTIKIGTSERKPMFVNLCEARFENINKDTLIMSKNKRILGDVAMIPHISRAPR